jgi:hypothetical protein
MGLRDVIIDTADNPDGELKFEDEWPDLHRLMHNKAQANELAANDVDPFTRTGPNVISLPGHNWDSSHYAHEMYRNAMGAEEFHRSLHKHMNVDYSGGPYQWKQQAQPAEHFARRYSAMRAPAGGAIVRGIYQPGGQALPAEAGTARPKASPRFARLVAKLKSKRVAVA